MFTKRSEKGQALVIIALAAVGLFAFTALSVDGGMVFSDRRHAQNAADTAVLAAALARVRAPTSSADAAAVTAGIARADSNGYADDADSKVEVNICSDPGISTPCQGLPAGAVLSEYVQVKITSDVHLTFARLIGREKLTNIVTAVARAQLGGNHPLVPGAALVALAPSGSRTIDGAANINLDINNSGIFDNSTGGCAFNTGGNGTINVDTAYTIASGGTNCQNGISMQGNVTDPSMYSSGSQIAYPPHLDIPTPSITCSGNGHTTAPDPAHGIEGQVFPGNFPSGLPPFNNGNWTFMPGSYCISGGITIGGNAHVTANYVDIKITSGELSVTSTLNCDYILLYTTGSSTGITFNGTSHLTCTNATFFVEKGSVSLLGNGAYTLTAPTAGPHPEYAHLLIYMPYGNNETLKITGNSGNNVTGSIIGVSAHVEISGDSGSTAIHSSITGYTISILGNSTTNIDYVPDEQFTQLDPAAIQITK